MYSVKDTNNDFSFKTKIHKLKKKVFIKLPNPKYQIFKITKTR